MRFSLAAVHVTWTVDFVAEVMEDEGHGNIVSIVFELEDILFHILSNLSTKELDQIARVNVTWYRVAKKIKQNRKQIVWFYYNVLDSGGIEKQMGRVLDNLTSEPHFALIFATKKLQHRISVPSLFSRSGKKCLPRSAKREEITFSSYLERTLPPSCRIAGLVTDVIVATRVSPNHTVQLERDASASCLFFPKLNGVDIYHFMLDNNVGAGAKKKPFSAIPEDKFPKLILLFENEDESLTDKQFYSQIFKNYGDVVIAGGIVYSLFADGTFKLQNQCIGYEPFSLGVAFCGGSGLHAASVVIRANKNSEKLIEAELSRLKAVHVPEKCSVAFLFCDTARYSDEFFYLKRNADPVESKVFKKLFPDVPLFGFYGDEEIGFDHLPGSGDTKNRSATVDYRKMNFHHDEGTAIFVILYFP